MFFKKLIRILMSRAVTIAVLMLIQIGLLAGVILYLSRSAVYIYVLLEALGLLVVLYLLSRDGNPSYKIAWIVPVMFFPMFGGIFYLMLGSLRVSRHLQGDLNEARSQTSCYQTEDPALMHRLEQEDLDFYHRSNYIGRVSGYYPYTNTRSEYFPSGEALFPVMLEELKKAEKFIFIETFIIGPGLFWDSILEVLCQKAAAGVDVRVIYDDVGCLNTLPPKYYLTLRQQGIKTVVFNPLMPALSTYLNYRDHRKICVIDGNTGFNGGINLADEYINARERLGYWKDTAVMLQGEGVCNLTFMFLRMWRHASAERDDFDQFRPTCSARADGYVQSFADSPLDRHNVAENSFLQLINRAERYLYITTPYLILDYSMVTALKIAAQSGVDVRIVTPHIADKWFVHFVSQSYYRQLVEAGVKIYEFTPGFIHSKMLVSDDNIAVVGSINLDYRSLYLHFECGTVFYSGSMPRRVREDILDTIGRSEEITLAWCRKTPRLKALVQTILRSFAPLM